MNDITGWYIAAGPTSIPPGTAHAAALGEPCLWYYDRAHGKWTRHLDEATCFEDGEATVLLALMETRYRDREVRLMARKELT